MDDFLMTNEAVELDATSLRLADWLSERAGRQINPKDVFPLVGVERDFLYAAHSAIDEAYGSMDRYFTDGLGIGPDEREKLRSLYLTD